MSAEEAVNKARREIIAEMKAKDPNFGKFETPVLREPRIERPPLKDDPAFSEKGRRNFVALGRAALKGGRQAFNRKWEERFGTAAANPNPPKAS
jgi:hypothetical protein